MSQVMFRDISLKNLVASASLVIQATYHEDSTGDKTGGHAFTVDGVWSPQAQPLATGQKIRVWQASAEAWGTADMHHRQTGMNISPIVDSLEANSAEKLVSGQTYVLFLHKGVAKNEFVFEAQNAFVRPARFEELRDISPNLRWTGQAVDTHGGAVLKTGALKISIDRLVHWPAEVAGTKIQATGLLRKSAVPGAKGGRWVLENARWKRLSAALEIEARTNKRTYAPGEDIVILASVRNTSEEPFVLFDYDDLNGMYLFDVVLSSGKRPIKLRRPWAAEKTAHGRKEISILAGHTWQAKLHLKDWLDSNGHEGLTPGTYSLEVVWDPLDRNNLARPLLDQKGVRSPAVHFSVEYPYGG